MEYSESQKDKLASLLDGPFEDRIKAWLQLSRNQDGTLKAGDWMHSLLPFVEFHSFAEEPPTITFTFTVQQDHCNRMGNLHGGAAATLFDFCTSLPLVLICKPGFWQYLGVSRNLNVTYMRPAPPGTECLVECQIVQVGKKLCTMRGTMRRKSDGQILSICEHGKVNTDPEYKL